MEIKAVKFRKDGFYTQPFIFGGEDGVEKYDKNVRYRGSLQNYLIDTGDEVILVGVFSNESALHIRWPKYWSFSFNISPLSFIVCCTFDDNNRGIILS